MEEVSDQILFQDAYEMYLRKEVSSKEEAAVLANLKTSTFIHRSNGRQSKKEYSKSMRLLNDPEEDQVIWRCTILQKAGFPQRIKSVHTMAEKILQKRRPEKNLGIHWVDQGLYKRHPEVKSRWSQCLEAVRVKAGNDLAALEQFFQDVSLFDYSTISHSKFFG